MVSNETETPTQKLLGDDTVIKNQNFDDDADKDTRL